MLTPEAVNDPSNAPVESWLVEKVIPYRLNHKIHTPKQVTALAASIKDQGLNDPVTVDADGVIISGHGRLEAVKSLGWTHVPVRHLSMLTKEQADKLRIAANKTASTEYDWDVLQRELRRLGSLDTDMSTMGFDDKELAMVFEDVGDINLDKIAGDVGAEVEQFESDTRKAAEAAEAEMIPMSQVFGIKQLPLKAKRFGLQFMAEIEKATGLKGAEALMVFMGRYSAP